MCGAKFRPLSGGRENGRIEDFDPKTGPQKVVHFAKIPEFYAPESGVPTPISIARPFSRVFYDPRKHDFGRNLLPVENVHFSGGGKNTIGAGRLWKPTLKSDRKCAKSVVVLPKLYVDRRYIRVKYYKDRGIKVLLGRPGYGIRSRMTPVSYRKRPRYPGSVPPGVPPPVSDPRIDPDLEGFSDGFGGVFRPIYPRK